MSLCTPYLRIQFFCLPVRRGLNRGMIHRTTKQEWSVMHRLTSMLSALCSVSMVCSVVPLRVRVTHCVRASNKSFFAWLLCTRISFIPMPIYLYAFLVPVPWRLLSIFESGKSSRLLRLSIQPVIRLFCSSNLRRESQEKRSRLKKTTQILA